MIKRLLQVLIPILVIATFNLNVSATDIIEIDPQQIIVKETDLGKTFTINLRNTTDKKISLKATEILFEKTDSGIINPTETEVIETALEMFTNEITLAPGAEFEHKVRVKFSTSNYTNTYPGLKYENQQAADLTYNYTGYVPFLIQNREGEYKMGIDIAISNSDISTTADIDVSGSIINEGGKFFNASGSVLIYKDNKLLFEQDVSEQFAGLIFPSNSKDFQLNYQITDNSINAIGEYKVEIQVKSDINTSTKVAAINFMYIPFEVIKTGLLILGAIIGIIILIFLIIKLRNRNKIQESY